MEIWGKYHFPIMAPTKWPPFWPEGEIDVALYPQTLIMTKGISVPSFMLVPQNARFFHISLGLSWRHSKWPPGCHEISRYFELYSKRWTHPSILYWLIDRVTFIAHMWGSTVAKHSEKHTILTHGAGEAADTFVILGSDTIIYSNFVSRPSRPIGLRDWIQRIVQNQTPFLVSMKILCRCIF